ncbi:hypothetical protein QE441_002070 [Chryseobacterium sp. SORGH_AS909]|uniref:Uncharacterized protein n=1 Tax=Chryseobacterium camelliae TaxID=1265445 RepID=A0ABU0TD29_9FLAO|nr:hypothetical protein [Chryseobacterium camelliae]MDQ1098928.1 hypothetical protein [Chryseobacterium sp. SORGH_AS_1048]MDR6086276.1 hypothetical protein [Chryseobacterium sp. SORGH_AS_0909]MDR6130648.1 hypothetical protein [Chryseobacterium sp. SORGH_AS_1175]MDT3407222.1 hypothetical protein [Pseudacidovorax intermedius]
MKLLHNISDMNSTQPGGQPKGQRYACNVLLDNEFINERCLYIWVS